MNPDLPVQAASLTVRTLLDGHAHRYPDLVHLVDPGSGRKLTYLQSRNKAAQLAQSLAELGHKPGDPVAYAFSNSIEGALAILGLLYGGYLATAINLVAGADAINYVLDHSETRLILVDEQAKILLESLLPPKKTGLRIVPLATLLRQPCALQSPLLVPPSPESLALLMYTSGTTGKPKGVLHTQKSLLCGGQNVVIAHKLTAKDCGLCVLPFYHINAFCVSLLGSLLSRGSLVIPPKFSVSSFWSAIRACQCSWFSVVPTQISYLLYDDKQPRDGLDCVRFGRSASAPLSPDMHAAFEKRFNIALIETMGLTETAAQILSNPLPPAKRHIGSPGIAFGNEVMIGDLDQNAVQSGVEGEILVRGPNLLHGYLKDEAAMAEAITGSGWLRTGDLGMMDEDGYVFVKGRLKELIIKGGENIAPREIDEVLYSHCDVVEAAAFGVACRDYGQRIEAGVKLCDGSLASADDLIAHCHQRLGRFKSPDRIHLLSELPKGPSGKIQRSKLTANRSND